MKQQNQTVCECGDYFLTLVGTVVVPHVDLIGQTHDQRECRSATEQEGRFHVATSSKQPPAPKISFPGGGHRDVETDKPRFDLLRPVTVPYEHQLMTRWAALMARGGKRYGDRNWEQMSDRAALDRFRSSAARHFEQWLNGEDDEDHCVAVCFNLQGAEYVAGVLRGDWEAH